VRTRTNEEVSDTYVYTYTYKYTHVGKHIRVCVGGGVRESRRGGGHLILEEQAVVQAEEHYPKTHASRANLEQEYTSVHVCACAMRVGVCARARAGHACAALVVECVCVCVFVRPRRVAVSARFLQMHVDLLPSM